MSQTQKILIALIWLLATLLVVDAARAAERVKDLASISGVRANQLVGYGIVVGLDGSGDQTPFTNQSMINMLASLGVSLPPGQNLPLKNAAAVIVTASLPAFARAGQAIDVTVSSLGNAKSLKGGTLIMTPLKGADGQVYALAQGNITVHAPAAAAPGGAAPAAGHLAVGRINGGATVEREVPTVLGEGEFITVDLHGGDFATTQRVVEAINGAFPGSPAEAVDARQVRVRAPLAANERVAFLGRLENLEVSPARPAAKVIVNSRSGSVVMNQAVKLENCAVAHGTLSVIVRPGEQPPGEAKAGDVVMNVEGGANLAEVVKALNLLGAKPADLVAILQAMKAAGALRAELEVI